MVGRYAIVELIGTMFLTLAIAVTKDPLYIGLMLMAVTYIGGHISGGHYNPAVSLASWVRGGLSNEHLITYILSQVVGAWMGLSAATWIGAGLALDAGMAGGGRVEMVPLLMELLLTLAFVMVVLTLSKVAPYKGSPVGGMLTGLSFAGALAAGSAVLLNPAVALGKALADFFRGNGMVGTQSLLVYVGGPLLGAAAAAWLFNFINESGKR